MGFFFKNQPPAKPFWAKQVIEDKVESLKNELMDIDKNIFIEVSKQLV